VYTCPDYLSEEFQQKQIEEVSCNPNLFFPSGMSTSSASSCTGINEVWREKICEWCYQVVDHFDYNRQVVAIALNYLDRYLALRPVNRKIFQLAAMTCLFIAIKQNETRVLSLSAFLSLSRGYFQAEHVLKMEHAILRLVFCYDLHMPCPKIDFRDAPWNITLTFRDISLILEPYSGASTPRHHLFKRNIFFSSSRETSNEKQKSWKSLGFLLK